MAHTTQELRFPDVVRGRKPSREYGAYAPLHSGDDQGFVGTELFFRPDLWVPMMNEQQLEGYDFLESRANHGIWLVGRLKPRITVAQAEYNLNAVTQQLSKQYPDDDRLKMSLSRPGFIGDTLGGPVRAFLFGVMLLAGMVLLAACANLGSLFAARAADRARELS